MLLIVKMRFRHRHTRLNTIHEALPNYPLVLHGGASLPKHLIDEVNAQGTRVPYMRNASEKEIARCGKHGVVKINMDVDNLMAFTTQIRKAMN